MAFAANPFLSEEDRRVFRRERRVFLVAISSGTLLNPLNSSMISMALHQIQEVFGVSFATASWVISVFYLASAIGQPVMGKLGNLFGRRTIFLVGLLIATVPAVSAPFVSSFALLLVLRGLQAVGTSAIYPSGMGLIRSHIHYRQSYALSVISIFSSATVALGPTIGGLAVSWGGWPAIFTINIPFLLLSFALAWFIFPKDAAHEKHGVKETIHSLDLPGVFLFGGALVGLLLFFLSFKTNVRYEMGIIGALLFIGFIRHEGRRQDPFVNMRMFQKNGMLTRVNVLFIILNIYNYALLFGLPTYFQSAMKLGVPMSGFLMLFIAGFGIIVSPITGKWADRVGVVQPLLLGSSLLLVGGILLTFVFTHLSLYWTIPVLAIMGIGYGFNNVSLQSALLLAAAPEEIGVASGLFQTGKYIGAIIASVLLGLLFSKAVTPFMLQVLGAILTALSLCSLWLSKNIKNF